MKERIHATACEYGVYCKPAIPMLCYVRKMGLRLMCKLLAFAVRITTISWRMKMTSQPDGQFGTLP